MKTPTQLHSRPSMWQALLDMPLGVAWKNKRGQYQGCNRYLAELAGLSCDEMIGQTDEPLPWGIQADSLLKASRAVLTTNKVTMTEETRATTLGDLDCLCIRSPWVENNETRGWVEVLCVITTLKERENRLRSEQAELQLYFDNIIASIPGSIYWKDKNGVYLGCNNYVARMADVFSPEDVMGKTDYELPWRDIADELKCIDTEIMQSNQPRVLEETGTVGSGRIATLLSTKSPLHDRNGNVIGIIGNSIDITERKQLEKELLQAKETAEQASRTKTDFLANIRHDFRTTLGGIVTIAEILHKRIEPKTELSELTEALKHSSQQFTDILENILNTVDIQSGHVPVVKKRFRIDDIAKEVIDLHASAGLSRNIALHYDRHPEVPEYLLGDCNRIKRILVELVSNAMKFIERGSITLEVQGGGESERDNQMVLALSVIDTGVGMTKDLQERIFDHFSRGTPAYEGKYPGLGLGLSNVKRLMTDLKGQIHVKSDVDKGSRFTCFIPLEYSLMDLLSKSKKGASKPQRRDLHRERSQESGLMEQKMNNPKRAAQNTLHILLVEDNPIAALGARKALSSSQVQVTLVDSGEAAIQAVQEQCFDLILMDIGLGTGKMDGYAATQAIRRWEFAQGRPQTPVIALTGHVDQSGHDKAFEVGVTQVLNKPLTEKKIQVIHNFLSQLGYVVKDAQG